MCCIKTIKAPSLSIYLQYLSGLLYFFYSHQPVNVLPITGSPDISDIVNKLLKAWPTWLVNCEFNLSVS